MSMSRIYSNDDYANQRLRNCVVMRNGEPFFIETALMDGQVRGTPLTGKGLDECVMERVPFSFDEGFSLQTVPLGFMNTRGDARYLSRVPQRRWRQGLVADSVQGGAMSTRAFFTKSFYNMVSGEYPSVGECIDRVASGEVRSRAFNRKFAVSYRRGERDIFSLVYKRTVIGIVNRDGSYELNSKHMYLEKRLRKAMQC